MLVSAEDAALALNKDAGHLRRKWCPELAGRGLAFQGPGPDGGQPRWWIDRRADPALAPGRVGEENRPADRGRFKRDQNSRADLKKRCVQMLRHNRVHAPGTQADWMPKLLERCAEVYGRRVSRSTLLNWDKAMKTAPDRAAGHEALVDKRGGDQKSNGDPAAWDHFKSLYLDDRQPSLADCWRRTKRWASDRSIAWCSRSSCYQQLDTRIAPEVQAFHRDPRKWRQTCEAGIDQDIEAWGAGELWVGDHAQLDFFVRVPGRPGSVRPWITAWIDWRTRRVVGYHLSLGPNSSTILIAFRKAMLDPANQGGPSDVSIDNGKDYDAWFFHGQTKQERRQSVRGDLEQDETLFRGIYAELDITAHFSIPYGPNGKARMERWFRTLHETFGISYESYAGRSTSAKPEMLAKVRKNPRLVPTFDQVRQDLDRYIAAYNARAGHGIEDLVDEYGNRVSPDQAMAQWRTTTRVFNPGALDLFLQHWHKPVRVSRRGIGIAPYGEKLWYGRWDAALTPFKPGHKNGKRVKGREVLVSFDPDDDRTVRVFTTDWRFICEARRDDAAGGNNHEAHRQGAAAKRRYKRSLKFVAENPQLAYLSADEALLADEPPPEDNPPPTQAVAIPGSMRIVQTPIDDQLKDVERERMRQAAGGEHRPDEPEDDDIDVLGALAKLSAPHHDQKDEDDELERDGFSLDQLNTPEFQCTPQATANGSPDGELLGDEDTDVTLNFEPLEAVDEDDDELPGDILDLL